MSKPMASLVLPCCNQGDWVRRTVARAKESFGDIAHEIIVVDDHSLDGCCHGLPRDVVIVRPRIRLGVTGARRYGADRSLGDVIMFSDPHLEYPGHALESLAKAASETAAMHQLPVTYSAAPPYRIYHGGKLESSERGLRIQPLRETADQPALYNSVYAVQRDVYQSFGGWPKLPGPWGYAEQALSLACWFCGVPIKVVDSHFCIHHEYRKAGKFPFPVTHEDWAKNAFYLHALFFYKTYHTHWRPMLESHMGNKPQFVAPIRSKEFQNDRKALLGRFKRDEGEFFAEVLRTPLATPVTTAALEADQARLFRPREYEVAKARIKRSLNWMREQIPGCLNGRKALVLGTRDGFDATQLEKLGCKPVEGVEIIQSCAEFANQSVGPRIRHGDMRELPDKDGSWHLVVSIHSLEHMPDPQRARDEMVRVTMPHGWIYVVVPRESVIRPTDHHHFKWPTEAALTEFMLANSDLDPGSVRITTGSAYRPQNKELRILVRKRSKMPARPEREKPIDGLEVVMFAAAAPWNPSIDIAAKTVEGIYEVVGRQVPITIYCDGPADWLTKQEAHAYAQWRDRVRLEDWGPMRKSAKWVGLPGMVRVMVADCKQPVLFVCQADWQFLGGDRVDFPALLACMRQEPSVQHVRLHKRVLSDQEGARYAKTWQDVSSPCTVPLLATNGWGDSPHVATLDHYQKNVLPNMRDIVGQDKRYGVEAFVGREYSRRQGEVGFVQAHREWGCWFYGNRGDAGYIRHLGDAARDWRKAHGL